MTFKVKLRQKKIIEIRRDDEESEVEDVEEEQEEGEDHDVYTDDNDGYTEEAKEEADNRAKRQRKITEWSKWWRTETRARSRADAVDDYDNFS